VLDNQFAIGPHEARVFLSQAYQPILRVPFTVVSPNGVDLTCDQRVLDGKTMFIKWDASRININNPYMSISLYPKNQMCASFDKRIPITTVKGKMEVVVDSGIRQKSGSWEVRFFMSSRESPHAVCGFTLIGVNEWFFEKMYKHPHKDVDILCYNSDMMVD
jgi:hypothetical protein